MCTHHHSVNSSLRTWQYVKEHSLRRCSYLARLAVQYMIAEQHMLLRTSHLADTVPDQVTTKLRVSCACRILYCCLSLSCLLIAASTTYGLGGFLRYGKTADSGTMWQFFQPFSGGTAFVATQAIGWSLFSTTIVLIVVMVQQLISGVAHCIRCWALGAGCLAVTAQAVRLQYASPACCCCV